MRPIVPRSAAALAAVFLLSGSVVVSCEGDEPGSTSTPTDRPASRAFGVWTPPRAEGTETVCTKEQHDSYFVVAPDGKKYPTWHPPVLTDASGNVTCVFGHEHGNNPAAAVGGYDGWTELRQHFAFDANGNGVVDDSELTTSGIPFGYASEQAAGTGALLTEPHESYKIVFGNDRVRTRQINNQTVSDVTCDQLIAFNQDTATTAAVANHRYSVIYAADCASSGNATLPAYRAKVIVSGLATYGLPAVITPVSAPSAASGRQLPTQERAYANILVPAGQTSEYALGLRERWNGSLTLARPGGITLASMDVGVSTTDPARFVQSATTPTARDSIDLCYVGLNAAGNEAAAGVVRQARGGGCAALANGSGPTVPVGSRVVAGSKDSPFRGCQRSAFFAGLNVRNNAGPRVWYSDADGNNAVTTYSANLLKQLVEISDSGNSVLTEDQRLDNSPSCASVRTPN